jgi:hypothetical protein
MKHTLVTFLTLLTTGGAFTPAKHYHAGVSSFRSSAPLQSYYSDTICSSRESAAGSTSSTGKPQSYSSSSATHPSMSFLQDLLEKIAHEGNASKLVDASADKWREAIFAAVGAPSHANPAMVSQALTFSMSKPGSQFAILMGLDEPFVVNFPSEAVESDECDTVWMECRLRGATDDELLVTLGVTMQNVNGEWKFSSLDWQDFRDKFYPGLSGRESWLRF